MGLLQLVVALCADSLYPLFYSVKRVFVGEVVEAFVHALLIVCAGGHIYDDLGGIADRNSVIQNRSLAV